ncbi:hypothetical protein B0H11DRAFT_2272300 [Mycena galericulata]|nr:hypothetical protein B0H11DRAFT_2272300 [Mycena galericulata]
MRKRQVSWAWAWRVHRLQSKPPTLESEPWNRAFWALVLYDRISSSGLGRPCALHIDIEFPTECDDGYWESESPALPFQQPPGTPSLVSTYVALLRLSNILAFSLRVVEPTAWQRWHILKAESASLAHGFAVVISSCLHQGQVSEDDLKWWMAECCISSLPCLGLVQHLQ